jgi:hypothetical protein
MTTTDDTPNLSESAQRLLVLRFGSDRYLEHVSWDPLIADAIAELVLAGFVERSEQGACTAGLHLTDLGRKALETIA